MRAAELSVAILRMAVDHSCDAVPWSTDRTIACPQSDLSSEDQGRHRLLANLASAFAERMVLYSASFASVPLVSCVSQEPHSRNNSCCSSPVFCSFFGRALLDSVFVFAFLLLTDLSQSTHENEPGKLTQRKTRKPNCRSGRKSASPQSGMVLEDITQQGGVSANTQKAAHRQRDGCGLPCSLPPPCQ